MRIVHVGLSAWIVQDGNYGDFAVGDSHRFALEFGPEHLVETGSSMDDNLLQHRSGALHDVHGTILRVTSSDWVIDFGVPTFQETKPPRWARAGKRVRGSVYVGIDPFFYFERLKDEPGMPDLFRRWSIRRILLETTPWTDSIDEAGRMLRTRSDVPPTFTEVRKTDAWKDDGGHAHYVLECELQGDA